MDISGIVQQTINLRFPYFLKSLLKSGDSSSPASNKAEEKGGKRMQKR